MAVKFPNLLNTHFFSGYKVDDPLNTHSTPTFFLQCRQRVPCPCWASRSQAHSNNGKLNQIKQNVKNVLIRNERELNIEAKEALAKRGLCELVEALEAQGARSLCCPPTDPYDARRRPTPLAGQNGRPHNLTPESRRGYTTESIDSRVEQGRTLPFATLIALHTIVSPNNHHASLLSIEVDRAR